MKITFFKKSLLAWLLPICLLGHSAEDVTVSKELLAPLQEVQQFFKDKQYTQALDKLSALEKIKVPTVDEQLLIERLRSVSALYAGKLDVASASYDKMIASPKLDSAEIPTLLEVKAGIDLRRKAFKDSADAANTYFQKGGTKASVRLIWAQSSYFAGDLKNASNQALLLVNAFTEKNATPERAVLELLASSQQGLKDEAGYVQTLQKMVQFYPSPEYWEDLLGRLQSNKQFSADYSYDIYRLQLATKSMTLPDAVDMAQASIKLGFPSDALSALQATSSDPKANDYDKANAKRLLSEAEAAVKADLQNNTAKRKAVIDVNSQFNEGYNLFVSGKLQEGTAAMRSAFDKGGLKRPDVARLRLASAYLLQGNSAEAKLLLEKFPADSAGSTLGRLWQFATQSKV